MHLEKEITFQLIILCGYRYSFKYCIIVKTTESIKTSGFMIFDRFLYAKQNQTSFVYDIISFLGFALRILLTCCFMLHSLG